MDPDRRLGQFGSTVFTTLRPLQRDALVGATQPNAPRDLAIELPTGYGKTLVGLLLAADVMDRGESTVYLTFSRQLANQVADEAEQLGLATEVIASPVREVGTAARRRVNRGQALGVMNYWAYLLDDPVVEAPAVLIFDDAHLAESPLAGRYSLTVERSAHPSLFQALLELIAERAPGYPVVDDAVAGTPNPASRIELLAFPHVTVLVDAARELFDQHAPGAADLRYPLDRLRHALERCLWLVGRDSIQVRPLRYPLDEDPAFADAGRRVYLSATLADLTDLRRRLGTPAVSKLELPHDQIALPGNRLLLAFDTEPDDETKQAVRAELTAVTPRAVWFTPSKREAGTIRSQQRALGRRVTELDREGTNLAAFVTARNADLVVAGRYDGIDLAGDEARLAFFTSAPHGTDPFDAFMSDNFRNASFLSSRVAERLTQALGRMTRDEADWAVIVLESASMAHQLGRNDIIGLLPDKLYREVETALDRAEVSAVDQARAAADVLAGRSPLPTPGDYRRRATPPTAWPDTWAEQEARYGASMWAGVSDAAIPAATRLLNSLGDHTLRPWWLYLRAHAAYMSYVRTGRNDRLDAALADLEGAVRAGGRTTWFGRVEAATQLVRTERRTPAATPTVLPPVVDFAASFRSDARYQAWCREVSDGLASGDHDRVARAWTEIGKALGYAATVPSGGAATDSLWRGGAGSTVFEAKIEHAADASITRRDVNQLLGQIEAEEATGARTRGAFLTHLDTFHADVGAVAGAVTVVSLDVATSVWGRVRTLLDRARDAIAAGHTTGQIEPPGEWLERLLDGGRGRVLTTADLDRAWPRGR